MRWLLLCCCTIASFALPAAARAEPGFELTGKGVQIYTCTQKQSDFAWTLKAPDASLVDAKGLTVGHHFGGPTWQGTDGSLVTGEPEYAAAGGPDSVAWLVLRAKTHSGSGLFSSVKAIVRSQTQGGVAPASGCDAPHAGAEVRVPYSATYTFFPD